MSEVMDLSALLASAPANLPLETTDTLFAIASDGSIKRIKRKALGADSAYAATTFDDNTRKWYTVANVTAASAWGGLLMVQDGNWSGVPRLMIYAIGGRYANQVPERPKVQSLLGTDGYVKLRAVRIDTNIRIDVYLATKRIEAQSFGNLPLVAPKVADDVPSGATVWEYNFASSTSGI